MGMVEKICRSWKRYRYRFVPWLKITPTKLLSCVENKVITDDEVLRQLTGIFTNLNNFRHSDANLILEKVAGFQVICQTSSIVDGGTGVFISKGKAKKGQVVAIYPGTVYLPSDFIFFQSIANQFIFRCIDNIHIDGKNRGISKMVYKSCFHRDKVGFYDVCDVNWLDPSDLQCPLNVGQFVNNKTQLLDANVQYQEFNFTHGFPLELRKFIPNVNVGGLHSTEFVRTVVLVALRDIYVGEELLSHYFTFTQST